MKNLCTLLAVLIGLLISTAINAQNLKLRGGLNLSTIVAEDTNRLFVDNLENVTGFHVGPIVELPLLGLFSLETGILLSTKGYQSRLELQFPDEEIIAETKARFTYLDIPITAKATIGLGGINAYGVFGPYLGVGLIGKGTYDETVNGEREIEEIKLSWGSDPDRDHLKRLDYGLVAGAGIELKSIQLGIYYNYGLADIFVYTNGQNEVNNRVLRVSLSYVLLGD